jgi:hypothetical protein
MNATNAFQRIRQPDRPDALPARAGLFRGMPPPCERLPGHDFLVLNLHPDMTPETIVPKPDRATPREF